MSGDDIDMRMFAQRTGASVTYPAGSVVFNQGDPGSCMYIVQSGVIEMVIGDKVVEVCGPNEAIGFMSMVDGAPRSSTARVKEACELSLIDARKFRFMVTRCRISRSTSWARWRGASAA
jgi:CRP/FNR family transcriptional regulator, cyclic AMP receptor protein